MKTKRTPFLKALVGSHNYNLQVPESDKDYKYFVLPTFDDLFTNRDFAKSYTGEESDMEYKDARQLVHLWWKTNVNFTEVLFSQEITTFPEAEGYVELLLIIREDIARMNLPYLHRSSLGMLKTKLKSAKVNYESTQAPEGLTVKGIVRPWGKDMMTAYRIADTFLRYHANGFTSFGNAIRYSDKEREFLLSIRAEEIPYEEALKLVKEKEQALLDIQIDYPKEEGEKTKQVVEYTLREAVKENLLKEFAG